MSSLSKQLQSPGRKRQRLHHHSERKETNHKTTSSFPQELSLFTLHPDPQTGLIDKHNFLSTYEKYQVVYFPQLLNGVGKNMSMTSISASGDKRIHWRDISSIFHKLNEKDRSSWTEENYTKTFYDNMNTNNEINVSTKDCQSSPPGAILNNHDQGISVRGYSSFIVQHDKDAMDDVLNSIPMIHLPIAKNSDTNKCENSNSIMRMKYSPCIWFFYGRNDTLSSSSSSSSPQTIPLAGRPEHTDSISHHGTWHYQLSGIKEWHIRPTDELINQMSENVSDVNKDCDKDESRRITISCKEGDVLLINTRLWWHSTIIPEQPIDDMKRSVPSVSYARDIYLSWDNNNNNNNNDDDDDITNDIIKNDSNDNMTNLDGLYASNDIEAGTIIFTEEDMPDCELHRTNENPNCEVVEIENENGKGSISAVVSCRDIKAGEFFCLLESDDEDDEEVDEYDYEEVNNDDNNV